MNVVKQEQFWETERNVKNTTTVFLFSISVSRVDYSPRVKGRRAIMRAFLIAEESIFWNLRLTPV